MTEFLFPLFMAVVQLSVLIGAVRMLHAGRRVLVVVFFAFAVASCLFSTLYWIVYDLLRPGTRMPFAANEICEWAQFLLLASSLRADFPERISLRKALLPAALFAAANTALWIAWSGEWVQDILTGFSLGWLLCVLISCFLASGALSRAEWFVLGAAAFLVIALQTATFLVPAAASQFLSLFCSVLLLAVAVLLPLKAVLSYRKGGRALPCFCLSYASFGWSIVVMYMSDNAVYYIALSLSILCYPLMLWAIRKEVAAE